MSWRRKSVWQEIALKVQIDDCTWYTRKPGEALNPGRENIETLRRIEKSVGTFNFMLQYQQEPVPVEGNLFRKKWFRTYESLPAEGEHKILISWDVASTDSDKADYSVATFWFLTEQGFYLFDLVRLRCDFNELVRRAVAYAAKYPQATTLVEKANTGYALLDTLARRGVRCCPYVPREDKVSRAMKHSVYIENGMVRFKKGAVWFPELLHECLVFPGGKYDDQVDSITQALDYALSSFRRIPNTGIVTAYLVGGH